METRMSAIGGAAFLMDRANFYIQMARNMSDGSSKVIDPDLEPSTIPTIRPLWAISR